MKLLIPLLLLICCLYQNVSAIAVMSVDLGSEWMKVAIVAPGVPMEIVLNKESKRKTPSAISFRNGERSFGEDALNVGVRFPKLSYQYILDLIGKDISNPLVKLYQERFPYYKIVPDEVRNTILFQHDEDTFYSPEELLAQILKRAKEFAETSVQQPIKDCVITVPGFFNQVERKALIQAAELADLKVLQLINDYTAVALNYAVFNQKNFNESAQYFLFYDMGASYTTASVIKFQIFKQKEHRYTETIPGLQIMGVGYDRTLGGLEMTLKLRDYLAKKFDEEKKLKNSIFTNPRALAKLYKEANRLKVILSANNEFLVQIESLFDDHDFKISVKRELFENLIQDLLERVTGPIEMALKNSGMTQEEISQINLVGAGVRVPKVQEYLTSYLKKDLSKNLNFDESAAMGAIYKGAELSTGFQTKKILIKDSILFPIQINFEKESSNSIDSVPEEHEKRIVKKLLFGLGNIYPQKKVITFSKFQSDFEFFVNYAVFPTLSQKEILNIGCLNLSRIEILDVKKALDKNSGSEYEFKGIKSHFAYSESGILNLTLVEATFEKTLFENDKIAEESPLSKLGATISKLFSNAQEEPTETVKEEPESTKEAPEPQNGAATATNATENVGNDTQKIEKNQKKIILVKEVLQFSETENVVKNTPKIMTEELLQGARNKILALDRVDFEKNRRETALNMLETILIDAKTKFENPDYEVCATKEEKYKILEVSQTNLDWLYEEGEMATFEVFEKKILEFQKLTNDLNMRFWEMNERPDAIKALKNMLDAANKFLESSKNFTSDKNVFTETELQNLEKIITETQTWLEKSKLEQKALKKSDPPLLTVKGVTEKMHYLDREVKYLVNKLKNWRPPTETKPKKKSTKNDETESENEEKGPDEQSTQEDGSPQVEKSPDDTPTTEKVDPEPPVDQKPDVEGVLEEVENHSEL